MEQDKIWRDGGGSRIHSWRKGRKSNQYVSKWPDLIDIRMVFNPIIVPAGVEPAKFQQKLTFAFKNQSNLDSVCNPFTGLICI